MVNIDSGNSKTFKVMYKADEEVFLKSFRTLIKVTILLRDTVLREEFVLRLTLRKPQTVSYL